jgi:hypothetical protein
LRDPKLAYILELHLGTAHGVYKVISSLVSGAASVTERHRTWSLVQLGQIGPTQEQPSELATPVK